MDRINKLLFSILTSFVIISIVLCGLSFIEHKETEVYKPRIIAVNNIIAPYVNEYISILEKNNIKIPIGKELLCVDFTSSLADDTLGVAWGMHIDNITFIQISKENWIFLSVQQKRFLIFHELSHDIFNLNHFDTTIMNTPMPSIYKASEVYIDNAIEELIQYIKNKDE